MQEVAVKPAVAKLADLTTCAAAEQAALFRSGDVSVRELVEAHIARIEAVNPALNAVVVKCYESARAEADDADRHRAAGDAGD